MFAIVFNNSPLADSPRMKPATSRQPIDVTVGRQATGRCGGAGPRPQDARAFGPIPVSRSICPRTNIAMVGPGSEGADDDDDCDALVKIAAPTPVKGRHGPQTHPARRDVPTGSGSMSTESAPRG